MTIIESAKADHDQLFGDRVSTLARTDPEFVAYFDNFAFDETFADAADLDSTVYQRTRLPVQLAAPGQGPCWTVLVPFIGYPRSLNALAAINDLTN